MKQLSSPVTAIETNSPIPEIAFKIKQSNLHRIFKTLANLYVDKISAIIRETLANAIDACVEAGNKNPVEIKTPTEEWPFLSISDKGVGMSRERIEDIYSEFGESTKRLSNNEIGAFGLGKFANFAYSEQFTVETVKDGNKIVFSMVAGRGITILSESVCDEPNGTAVICPIKEEDFATVTARIHSYSQLAAKHPITVNGKPLRPITDYCDKVFSYGSLSGYVFKSDIPAEVKTGFPEKKVFHNVGGVFYPERANLLKLSGASEINRSNINKLPYNFAILDVPMGSVDIHESRESLDYTEATNERLNELYRDVSEGLRIFMADFAEKTKEDSFLTFRGKIAWIPNNRNIMYRDVCTFHEADTVFNKLFICGKDKSRYDRSAYQSVGHNIGQTKKLPIKTSLWIEMNNKEKQYAAEKAGNAFRKYAYLFDDADLYYGAQTEYVSPNELKVKNFLIKNHGVTLFDATLDEIQSQMAAIKAQEREERKIAAQERREKKKKELAERIAKGEVIEKPVRELPSVSLYDGGVDFSIGNSAPAIAGEKYDVVVINKRPTEQDNLLYYAALCGIVGRKGVSKEVVFQGSIKNLQKIADVKILSLNKESVVAKAISDMKHDYFAYLCFSRNTTYFNGLRKKLIANKEVTLSQETNNLLDYLNESTLTQAKIELFNIIGGDLNKVFNFANIGDFMEKWRGVFETELSFDWRVDSSIQDAVNKTFFLEGIKGFDAAVKVIAAKNQEKAPFAAKKEFAA